MDFEFPLFLKSLPALARGAVLTAELTVISILIGTAIGTVAGVGRLSSHRVLAWSVATYVTLMRGIPLLVTLLFLYYGLPSAGIKLDAFTVGVIALSITSGAYIAEIVRAGIQSIDPGQMRAARSLGMSYAKAMLASGRAGEALPVWEQVATELSARYGPDSPGTLAARSSLAPRSRRTQRLMPSSLSMSRVPSIPPVLARWGICAIR